MFSPRPYVVLSTLMLQYSPNLASDVGCAKNRRSSTLNICIWDSVGCVSALRLDCLHLSPSLLSNISQLSQIGIPIAHIGAWGMAMFGVSQCSCLSCAIPRFPSSSGHAGCKPTKVNDRHVSHCILFSVLFSVYCIWPPCSVMFHWPKRGLPERHASLTFFLPSETDNSTVSCY